ncbi:MULTISPECIES: hypothetical protein [Ensifer]|uniref:IclR-ED domain-containing protein n=1 Tax=Ensifer adhaerens TaxID=106592 RepID=A0ABY8HRR5_ENSAD|nr:MULTISPECIES: hypothetical protein [Ensifer]ANK77531.1 hypothetical protein FA04_33485 [Ensifer adhaerens]KDP72298.1 hypothetical protein FA04_18435 [Ensifer adhaerens]MBD9544629.1 hypothetical protein [Ensifer sp. ENS04]MBD9597991.1 hypothetical protein [Ensifer sp. ENS05]QHG74602.1 hypothetical protein DQW09_33115 [Ensifer adhaerens]
MTSGLVDAELADMSRQPFVGETTDISRSRLEVRDLITQVRESGLSRCRSGLLTDYTALSAHTGTIIAAPPSRGLRGVLNDDMSGPNATVIRTLAQNISRDAGQRTTSYIPNMSRG